MTSNFVAIAEDLAAAWWPVFGTQWVSVKHLVRTAYGDDDDAAILALRGALRRAAPSDVAAAFVSSHRLGHFLVRAAGLVVPVTGSAAPAPATVTFVERGDDRGSKRWQLTPVVGAEPGEVRLERVA